MMRHRFAFCVQNFLFALQYDRCYFDLDRAIDEIRTRFKRQMQMPQGSYSTEALCRLHLAIHEWVANLARHARFREATPQVQVRVWATKSHLHSMIADNSEGFGLEEGLERQSQIIASSPDLPEGGMGLIIMDTCTEHMTYASTEERNHLRLSVKNAAGLPMPKEQVPEEILS